MTNCKLNERMIWKAKRIISKKTLVRKSYHQLLHQQLKMVYSAENLFTK